MKVILLIILVLSLIIFYICMKKRENFTNYENKFSKIEKDYWKKRLNNIEHEPELDNFYKLSGDKLILTDETKNDVILDIQLSNEELPSYYGKFWIKIYDSTRKSEKIYIKGPFKKNEKKS